jgi:hypothetical protein
VPARRSTIARAVSRSTRGVVSASMSEDRNQLAAGFLLRDVGAVDAHAAMKLIETLVAAASHERVGAAFTQPQIAAALERADAALPLTDFAAAAGGDTKRRARLARRDE